MDEKVFLLIPMNELVEIRYPFWQELFILLASTLTVMAGAAISPAMHELTQFFSSVPNYQLLTQLVLTITALAIAISAPIMGLLVDKLGRKPLLITSAILYVVFGTTGFYFKYLPINPTAILYLILAGRVMLGISVAGIMTCTTTLIGDHYKGEKRDQVMGYQAAFMAFGGAVFIVIAGVIARFGWNYSFLVYLFSVILLPGLILFIIEPSRIKKETIIHPEDSSKQDQVEGKIKFPLKILLISSFQMFILMIIFYFIPPNFATYLVTSYSVSNEILIGLAIAMINVTAGLIALLYNQIRKILNIQVIFIVALVLMAGGYFIISYGENYLTVVLGGSVMGIGFGLHQPNIISWLMMETPFKMRGRVVGIFITMLYLGQFISPIIALPIITGITLHGLYLAGAISLLALLLIPLTLLIINYVQRNKKVITEAPKPL